MAVSLFALKSQGSCLYRDNLIILLTIDGHYRCLAHIVNLATHYLDEEQSKALQSAQH